MTYYVALTEAMGRLASRDEALFVGQSVRYKSNAIFGTLEQVPMAKRIELPVIEDFQAGYCLGLALQGRLPVCIYPRWDFALLAANQIVNHIDKLPYTSFCADKDWLDMPRVIVRVAVGAKHPLHSGHQHTQDYTGAFRLMCKTMEVIELNCARDVLPGYGRAMVSERSCIVVERADLYGEQG